MGLVDGNFLQSEHQKRGHGPHNSAIAKQRQPEAALPEKKNVKNCSI